MRTLIVTLAIALFSATANADARNEPFLVQVC